MHTTFGDGTLQHLVTSFTKVYNLRQHLKDISLFSLVIVCYKVYAFCTYCEVRFRLKNYIGYDRLHIK